MKSPVSSKKCRTIHPNDVRCCGSTSVEQSKLTSSLLHTNLYTYILAIGDIEIELESGETITVEAKQYIKSLKEEAKALREALRREKMLPMSNDNSIQNNNNNMMGATITARQQQGQNADFGGIAQYIASRQGDIKTLTEGIQPEIVQTMKMLVDFVLEGGDSDQNNSKNGRKKVSREEMEMEVPGSALQQLALWQLVLGYRLREAEATGEYLKLLE